MIRRGVARTFQNLAIFPSMTVRRLLPLGGAGGTPHGAGHERVLAHRRAGQRPQDRRRLPQRGPQQPCCHRRLPGPDLMTEPTGRDADWTPPRAKGARRRLDRGARNERRGKAAPQKRPGCERENTACLRSPTGRRGTVSIAGAQLRPGEPAVAVAAGLSLVPQGRGTFTKLSVAENLLVGATGRRDKAGVAQDIDRWYEVFPALAARTGQAAGTLSGGEHQMLAVARSLMQPAKAPALRRAEPRAGPAGGAERVRHTAADQRRRRHGHAHRRAERGTRPGPGQPGLPARSRRGGQRSARWWCPSACR